MYAVDAKYIVLNGKEGEKKGGQEEVGKERERKRRGLDLIWHF